MAEDSATVQWQRWEGTLTAQKAHARPYHAIEIDLRFTGPIDASFRVPAFWDGDRGFRFRAAFPTAGVWRWQSSCNDADDAGLYGRSGSVRVAAYAGENPLYRHGDLRVSADRRYLVHADGTPFLWLGDTGWNAAWKSTAAEWQEYVETRARQRFSVLQIAATGMGSKTAPPPGRAPFLPDGVPDPLVWRTLDEKVAAANDQGLVVVLTGVGKPWVGPPEVQGTRAFSRYLAGRFAAHMVVYSPSMDQRYELLNEEAGVRLRSLTTHLVTQHPGTHFATAQKYHDAGYADFCSLQTGHHNGKLDLAYAAARDWTLGLWRRAPIKPVINVEAMYDAYGHDNAPNWREQDVRKLGWISWLSGSRGYTYGAGDVPPKVPGGAGGVWKFSSDANAYDHWRKALAWPSATQMTHLRDFLAGIEWWRLEPAPELVRNQTSAVLQQMVVSRSAQGDLLVAYLPDNAEAVFDLSALPDSLAGRWFEPRTAATIPVTNPLPRAPRVTLRRPDGWQDAVLLLTKGQSSAQSAKR